MVDSRERLLETEAAYYVCDVAQGGCLSKVPAVRLESLLAYAYNAALIEVAGTHPMRNPEDCAVLELQGQNRVLASIDCGPPVCEDALVAGRIAALHAFSDIFASGGVPQFALVLLVFRPCESEQVQNNVLVGILECCRNEHVQVVGGHTLRGPQNLVGLSVLGCEGPRGVIRKTGAVPGDRLLLSKQLGVGILHHLYARHELDAESFSEALKIMQVSNRNASLLALKAGVHAMTDVSGFGFLGHLVQMLTRGKGCRVSISSVPLISSVQRIVNQASAESMLYASVLRENLEYVKARVQIKGPVESPAMLPLLDPQTNGGLLVATSKSAASTLVRAGFAEIGEITTSEELELIT